MKKTFIMLVTGVKDILSESIVEHLTNYIGLMNIDTDNSNELPGVIYTGILTKAQKLELKEFIKSRTDFNIVPMFIEYEEKEDNANFIGTLSIKHDYNDDDNTPVPLFIKENMEKDYNSFVM